MDSRQFRFRLKNKKVSARTAGKKRVGEEEPPDRWWKKVFDLGVGIVPAASIPSMRGFRLVDLHSWTLCGILIAVYLVVLFGIENGNLRRVWQSVKSQRTHHWIISLLLGCLIGTGVTKAVNARIVHLDEEETFAQYCVEKKCLRNGSMGVNDFLDGRYAVAYDSLKIYADTSAVAAYYFGLLLYNGYDIEPDQVTGLRYMDIAAQKHYYRAVYEMLQHSVRIGDYNNIVHYAEMFMSARLRRVLVFPDEIGTEISSGPELDYANYEVNCYNNIISYYLYIAPDLSMAMYWTNIFYKPWMSKRKNDRKEIKNDKNADLPVRMSMYRDDPVQWEKEKARSVAMIYWTTGHFARGRRVMKNVIKKYPNDAWLHLEYAKIQLDYQNKDIPLDISSYSLRTLQNVERHLLLGLKQSSNDNNVSIQYECAKYLENLYRATGYREKAKQMNHLSANLYLKIFYEELDK